MFSLTQILGIHCFLIIILAQCPTNCECSNKTLICEVCLSLHYQTYDLAVSNCKCLVNFQKFHGGKDTCCPNNCDKCYLRGCATCKEHASTLWNNTFKYYQCVCDQNYYLQQTNCLCMSNRQPSKYYWNSMKNLCNRCPEGCNCSTNGCYSCTPESLRIVTQSFSNLKICDCIYPFRQVLGMCRCPINCTCTNETRQCSPQSHFYLNGNTWFCEQPYVQKDGSCQCIEPYFQIQILGKLECVCKSKINYVQYYQYNGKCNKCAQSCICGKNGTQYCYGTYIKSIDLKQQCINNSTKVDQGCACVSPFYQYSLGQCHCLSQLYPQLYYFQDTCQACPQNCICNTNGCIHCQEYSMLQSGNYSYFDYSTGQQITEFFCNCKQNSYKFQDYCICNQNFVWNEQTNMCQCGKDTSLFTFLYYHQCFVCPQHCLCDFERGCYFCPQHTQRVIQYQQIQNSKGETLNISFCFCKKTLSSNTDGSQCLCLSNQKYNVDTQRCHCSYPFYTYAIYSQYYELCLCLSYFDQINYYEDFITDQCKKCPIGCSCTYKGCVSCNNASLRYVYRAQVKYPFTIQTAYRCPCLQNTFQINQICTFCPNNSYFNGDICVNCPSCKTCDFRGCLSCNENMTLYQYECICNNENLTNIDGFCKCDQGYYIFQNTIDLFNIFTKCIKCTSNCLTCILLDYRQQCLSCNITRTFRHNSAKNGCPCLSGYTESLIKKQYCCSSFCEDCDELGCLSCPIYTLRTLVNRSCVCLDPYLEKSQLIKRGDNLSDYLVCNCPINSYYFNESCLKCPPNCWQCTYFQTQHQIVCRSCKEGVNRNTSTINCTCLSGYIQNYPINNYCSSIGCKNSQSNCSQCQYPRMLDSNNKCICSEGFYENSKNCQKCNFGCLLCQNNKSCLICNQSSNYYLASNICMKVYGTKFIFSQDKIKKFNIQIELHSNILFENITTTLYLMDLKKTSNRNTTSRKFGLNSQQQYHYSIDIIDSKIVKNNVLNILMQNPTQKSENNILSFLLFHKDKETYQTLNIYIKNILSYVQLQNVDDSSFTTFKVISIIFIFVTLIISIFGYKHNQSVFFMQTMLILGLFLKETRFKTTLALYNLKFTILLFKNFFVDQIMPQNYLESSPGNFKYLTTDSNLFRIVSILMLFQLITIIVITIIVITIQYSPNNTKRNVIMVNIKKKTFRLLESIFKINMYPIVLFSFHTLINVDCEVFMNKNFKSTSIVVSVLCLLIHGIFIIIFFTKFRLSKFNKLEHIFEFIFCCIISITLIFSVKVDILWIVLIYLGLLFKDFVHSLLRKLVSSRFYLISSLLKNSLLNLQMLGSLLQIIPLVLIHHNKPLPSIIIIFVIVSIQLIIQCKIINDSQNISQHDKMNLFTNDKDEIITQIQDFQQEEKNK